MLKSFNYFGSKNSPQVARWIVENLPEHDRYCEPFGGSGAILLNKRKCQEEIYSDIYEPAWFFMRCLRSVPDQLINKINYLLTCNNSDYDGDRREFTDEVPSASHRLTVEAAEFYLYCHYSWNGGGTNWSSGFSTSAKDPEPDHLIEASDRLQNVTILQQDAFKTIREFPSDERSFIYVDPPYLPSARKSKDDRKKDVANSMSRRRYAHEMTIDQHIELAELLQNRSAIVSGYDSHLYNELYKGWEKKSIKHANDTEVIWISQIAQEMTAQLSLSLELA